MEIQFMQALHGDCIAMTIYDSLDNQVNILVDGGPAGTYQFRNAKDNQEAGPLKKWLEQLESRGQKVDLLIVTHMDDDHIGGIEKWLSSEPGAHGLIREVWFNAGSLIAGHFKTQDYTENQFILETVQNNLTSTGQGLTFENYISTHKIMHPGLISSPQLINKFEIAFRILSPSIEKLHALCGLWEKVYPDSTTAGEENDYPPSLKELLKKDKFVEDKSIHNGSSIAFMISAGKKNFVFLADAHPQTVADSLRHFGYSETNKLNAELLKIPHHGSKANLSPQLLNLIDCNTFIISTNGQIHSLPDKQLLARIIDKYPASTLYFTYPGLIIKIFDDQDYKDHPLFTALPTKEKFDFILPMEK